MEGMEGGAAPQAGVGAEGGQPVGDVVNTQIDAGLEAGGQEAGADINNMELDSFVKDHLSSKFELSSEDIGRMKEIKEKYGLDNATLEKLVEIEADKKSLENDPTAKVEREMQRLSPEERAKVKDIDSFFKNKLSPEQYQKWSENFNTAESFRASQMLMESMSQTTPDLEGNTTKKQETFGVDNYYEYSNKIREAFKKADYEKVDKMKEEMYNKIRLYGDDKVKQLLK